MKIKDWRILFGIAAGFCLFSLGFFFGRNPVHPAVVTARSAPVVETLSPSLLDEPVFPLDINTATAGELTFLPGIGEATARNIVQWREENGGFTELADLLNVDGIGSSKLEQMLPYITIGG